MIASALSPASAYASAIFPSSIQYSSDSPLTIVANTTTTAATIAAYAEPMLRQVQMQVQVQSNSTPTLSPSPTPSSHKNSRSRQVLVACAACQKRKSKCTGERPRCSLCTLKNTSCLYETRFGEARSAQLKRRVQELSQENASLRDVINTLRTANPAQAANLLERIRGTAELDEALRLIGDSALLLSVRREDSGESIGSSASGGIEAEEDKGRCKRMAIDDLLS